MKKLITLFLVMLLLLACGGCKKQEEKKSMELQISQMKEICELAVMECYYHDVAKYTADADEGILWWKKDIKHFWVEYDAKVKFGIELSRLKIDVKDTQVTIMLPEAEVLGCTIDSLEEESFIVDKKSAKITVDDEKAALGLAEQKLIELASNDEILLANAQQRAQNLLEDYVNSVGEAIGVDYSITWVYLDAE